MTTPATSTSKTRDAREALIAKLLEHLESADGNFPSHPKPSRQWWSEVFHLTAAIRLADITLKGSPQCNTTTSPTPRPPLLRRLLERMKRSNR